ncbi:MAG: Type 1 glutamine amidotransferase-like domain-containing protein [Actinomycetota bacterium]
MAMTLGLFGSGEFLPWARDVDRHLLAAARAGDGSALIVPTASSPEGPEVFDNWARMGLEHYAAMNVKARLAPLRTREDAADPSVAAMVERASLVYFSGGNPAYLAQTLRDTPFWSAVIVAAEKGTAVAGCSAGACIFGEQAPDPTKIADIDQAFESRGLRVIPGIVFGAHWDALDTYYPGLQQLSLDVLTPEWTMVGLDEDTAMTTDGEVWRVFGGGAVTIYDDRDAPKVYRAGATFSLP